MRKCVKIISFLYYGLRKEEAKSLCARRGQSYGRRVGITMVRTLKIPCNVSKGKDVEIFLDELDENSIVDVLDLLRSEMAPLKVFRRVAVSNF